MEGFQRREGGRSNSCFARKPQQAAANRKETGKKLQLSYEHSMMIEGGVETQKRKLLGGKARLPANADQNKAKLTEHVVGGRCLYFAWLLDWLEDLRSDETMPRNEEKNPMPADAMESNADVSDRVDETCAANGC